MVAKIPTLTLYVVLIDTKMNDLDLYIEFVEGHVSCQPLRHIVD